MFQIGDVVECINDDGAGPYWPKVGDIYTISYTSEYSDLIGLLEYKESSGCWYASRFKLARPYTIEECF
jgi:hypothetical protein